MINLKKLTRSIKYACKGIAHVFKTEQNFRIQTLAAAAVILFAFYYKIKSWEAVALVLSIIVVLVLELINTTFEKIVDILTPRIDHYVKDIKDIMAATVLLASIGAFIVGILIFWPYLR